MKNQKGFTVVEIILVVALLAVIGVAGYFAYQNNQKATPTTATPEPTAKSADSMLRIADWRVQLALKGNLIGLTPGTASGSSYSAADQNVVIYAPELDASWTCVAVDGHKGQIGSISRTLEAKRSGPYEPLATKKLGSYTYGFESTETSNCTTSPVYKELVTSFKTAFQQLQSY